MNRSIPSLLLLLCAACARDLELVDPPAPPPVVDDGLPAPALLGPLSGDWLLETALEGGETAPTGWLRLLHLVDPKELEEERVLGFGLYGGFEAGIVAPSFACGGFVDAAYQGAAVEGSIQPFDCAGAPLPPQDFHAARVAGVAGLTSDLTMQVCPGGAARPLRARRACVFNASISGVYQGRSIACDGTETEFQLGLGFTGGEVTGWLHPWGGWTISGSYDPFVGGGLVELHDPKTQELQCGHLALRPVGETLALGLDVWAAVELQQLDGSILRSCPPQPEGCGLRRIEVTRLEGGTTESCDPSVFVRELRTEAVASRAGDASFVVDVRVYDAAGGAPLPPGAVRLSLVRASDGVEATQIEATEGLTGRFSLGDDACGVASSGWELFAVASASDGSAPPVARPSCLFVGPAPAAEPVMFEPCAEDGRRSPGGLVCREVEEGKLGWVRSCETSADCPDATTVCLAYLGVPFCIPGTCGDGALFGPGTNGGPWEACSGQGAAVTEDGPPPEGLCLAGEGGAVCLLAGHRAIGSQCRLDATRDVADLCEPGSLCWPLEDAPPAPRPCRCDADCAGEASRSVCDAGLGVCRPLGRCVDLCEAGTQPFEPGSLADCATPGQSCHPPDDAPLGAPHLVGACF